MQPLRVKSVVSIRKLESTWRVLWRLTLRDRARSFDRVLIPNVRGYLRSSVCGNNSSKSADPTGVLR